MDAYTPDFVLVDDTDWKRQLVETIDWNAVAALTADLLRSPGDRDAYRAAVENVIAPYSFDQMMEHGCETHLVPRLVPLMRANARLLDGNHRSVASGVLRRKRS